MRGGSEMVTGVVAVGGSRSGCGGCVGIAGRGECWCSCCWWLLVLLVVVVVVVVLADVAGLRVLVLVDVTNVSSSDIIPSGSAAVDKDPLWLSFRSSVKPSPGGRSMSYLDCLGIVG